MSEDFLKNPALAVRCPRQDRDRDRRIRRIRRARREGACRRRRQCRARREQSRRAEESRRGLRSTRRQGRDVAKRPSSEANCDAIVEAAVERFGGVDILVVASGLNKVSKIVDQPAEDFLDVMDANVTQSWLMARAAGAADAQARRGGKVDPDVVGARAARPSRRLHRLLRLEVGGRRHHQGARLRAGRDRHHRQCPRTDRVPLAAHRMDVRGQRARDRRAQRLSHAACRRAGSASRPISPARCCSSPRRRPTSTPATSSTPTAAIRPDESMAKDRQSRALPSSAPG